MNFKHDSSKIVIAVAIGIVILIVVCVLRHNIYSFLTSKPLYINPKFNFDRITFAIFSVSIGFPVVAQFIRNSMTDLDDLNPQIATKSAEADPGSKEKQNLDQLLNKIADLGGKLKKFNTYSEFKYHIAWSFVLLLLSAGNNCINNISIKNTSIVLLSNAFMICALTIIGYFLYIKINKMHSYVKKLNEGIAEVKEAYNQTPSERALRSLPPPLE